jgi:DNA polymerase-3 subunit beta
MKLICDKEILLDVINTVQKAVSPKTTMPILECIKLDAYGGRSVTFTGNNLELCIEYELGCDVPEGGSIALGSRMLGEIIRRTPSGRVSLEVNESNNVTKIKSGSSEFSIQGLTADDYPSAPEIEERFSFTISQEILKRMIRKTIFSASTIDVMLSGALFDIKENILSVVTTDKFRLSIGSCRLGNVDLPDSKFIIPLITLRELLKILKDEDDVKISVAERHAQFDFGEFKVMTRLVEGEFINYRPVLRADNTVFVTADTRLLCESLERASLLISDDSTAKKERVPVRLNISYDIMEVNCMTARGMVRDVIDVSLEGEGLEIGFNNRYLLEAVKAAEQENVRMEFSSAKSACFIRSNEAEEEYTYMILPVRLD